MPVIESLRDTPEHLFGNEKLDSKYRPVVRVQAFRLNDPNNTFGSLLPTAENIYSFSKSKSVPPIELGLVSSCWMVKGVTSNIDLQATLLGGGIETADGLDESPAQASKRELEEEGHIYGLSTDQIRNLTDRAYCFELPANVIDWAKKPTHVIHDEQILVTETPSFITPYAFDPVDNARLISMLSLSQEVELLAHDTTAIPELDGTRIHLVDSLSNDQSLRNRRKVQTDGKEAEVKDALIYQHYLFEAQVQEELIENLLRITSCRAGWVRRKWDGIKKGFSTTEEMKNFLSRASDFLTILEGELSSDGIDLTQANDVLDGSTINALQSEHIPAVIRTNIARRVRLIRELKSAYQRVTFEHNLRYMAPDKCGPQAPFLFIQHLLQLDNLTSYELELVQGYLELDNIFNTVLSVLAIDPKKDSDWYSTLKAKLRLYLMNKRIVSGPGHTEIFERSTEDVHNGMYKLFGEIYDIPQDRINYYIRKAWDFANYLDSPLRPYITTQVRTMIKPSVVDEQYLDLDELILRAFGISENQNHPIPTEERWLAWRTLLLTIKYIEAQGIKEAKSQGRGIKAPFKSAFNDLYEEDLGSETFTAEESFRRFRLKLKPTQSFQYEVNVGKIPIDLNRVPVEILSSFREKSAESILRKLLERSTREEADIDDFFGRKIILDDEKFWKELEKTYPGLDLEAYKEDIIGFWSKQVIQLIVNHYQNRCLEYANSHTSGVDITIDQNTLYTRSRVRDQGLEGILEHKKYEASGASRINWHWLKFVQKVQVKGKEYTEELQIYPRKREAVRKKNDEARYNTDRLFSVPVKLPNYFPLVAVLYQTHEAYRKLVRNRYARGVIFPGKPSDPLLASPLI